MQRGFSLLELSIVLVIIGLITGGIMAGQSMVRAAELRSVMTDVSKYKTAINTFRDKYNAIPGDMRNAVRYWGAQGGGTADGADATCQALTTAATGTATCNGNGDGLIAGNANEAFRTWQHLANAGLIEGQYTGVAGASGVADAEPGTNVPAAKIAGVGYSIRNLNTFVGDTSAFAGVYNHTVDVGMDSLTNYTYNPFLTPADAYSIDSKIDDGKPGQGYWLARFWSTCANATSNTDSAAATYQLTSSTKACAFHITNFF